jgi:hypothetical protein
LLVFILMPDIVLFLIHTVYIEVPVNITRLKQNITPNVSKHLMRPCWLVAGFPPRRPRFKLGLGHVGQSCTGAGFRVLQFPLPEIPPIAPHSSSSGAWCLVPGASVIVAPHPKKERKHLMNYIPEENTFQSHCSEILTMFNSLLLIRTVNDSIGSLLKVMELILYCSLCSPFCTSAVYINPFCMRCINFVSYLSFSSVYKSVQLLLCNNGSTKCHNFL